MCSWRCIPCPIKNVAPGKITDQNRFSAMPPPRTTVTVPNPTNTASACDCVFSSGVCSRVGNHPKPANTNEISAAMGIIKKPATTKSKRVSLLNQGRVPARTSRMSDRRRLITRSDALTSILIPGRNSERNSTVADLSNSLDLALILRFIIAFPFGFSHSRTFAISSNVCETSLALFNSILLGPIRSANSEHSLLRCSPVTAKAVLI